MEFRFSDTEETFKQELEDFLVEELPSDWPEKSMHWPGGYGSLETEDKESIKTTHAFRRKLAEKGWLTISWPVEDNDATEACKRDKSNLF